MKTAPLSILCLVLIAAFSLSACDAPYETPPPVEPTAEPAVVRAVPTPNSYGGVLTIRLRDKLTAINPLIAGEETQDLTALVFSGLMRFDPQMRPIPDLASTWTASPDELVWTFKLRPDVAWHDGVTFSSDDVIFTYRTLMDANAPASQARNTAIGVASADLQQVVEQIEALDAYTVQFRLRRRFAPLLADLTVPILPRHQLKDWSQAKLWQDPVEIGTGPFRLAERRSADALVLDAFQQYYGERPYMDRIAVFFSQDESATVEALREGKILLAAVPPDVAAKLAEETNVLVKDFQDSTFYYVGFNLRSGRPFADKSLRQAWDAASDRSQLVARTFGNAAAPIISDIPSYSWAYNSDLGKAPRDLAKARSLLDASGWQPGPDGIRVKAGQRLSIELAVRQDAPSRVEIAARLADQLREAGIEVRVTPADFGSTMAAARRPPFDFAAMLMGWTMGADPDDYYLFHSSQIPTADRSSGYNYVGFRNDEFDRLSVEARTTVDWKRRADLYRQNQLIVANELPYQYLWAERKYVAVSRRISGLPDVFSPSYWSTIRAWRIAQS